MTVNKYKFIGAMLALRDGFSASDIARYSDLNDQTVRTMLRQYESQLETIEKVATGRPGGQILRYQLRPEAAIALQRQLSEIFSVIQIAKPSVEQKLAVPLTLLAAQDALERRFPDAATVELKGRILEVAHVLLESASEELNLLGRQTDRPDSLVSHFNQLQEVWTKYHQLEAELATGGFVRVASQPTFPSSGNGACQ